MPAHVPTLTVLRRTSVIRTRPLTASRTPLVVLHRDRILSPQRAGV